MNAPKHLRNYLLLGILVVVLQPGIAQQNPDASTTSLQRAPTERDGQHDFDFEIGTWKTHLSRLLRPLTGSTTWVEYEARIPLGGPSGSIFAFAWFLCAILLLQFGDGAPAVTAEIFSERLGHSLVLSSGLEDALHESAGVTIGTLAPPLLYSTKRAG